MRIKNRSFRSLLSCVLTITIILGFISPAVTSLADSITLDIPTNVAWLEGSTATASWDAVENANYYNISVSAYDSSESLIGTESGGTTECSIDVQDMIRAIDGVSEYNTANVRFQVQAVYQEDGVEKNSGEWSLESDSKVYSLTAADKFDAPTGIVFNGEDYTVSWDMVEGATHYDVWYYIVDSENGDAWYANTPVYWFDGEGWMYGLNNESAAVTDGVMTVNASYDLNYFAVANNRIGEELELYCVVKVVSDDTSTYADSDWSEQSEIVTYCCNLNRLEAPSGVVFNGEDYTVSWNLVDGATRYEVWYYVVDPEYGEFGLASTMVSWSEYWNDGEGWAYGLNNEMADITDGVITINAISDLNYYAVANNRVGEELELYCIVKAVSEDTSTYADSDWSEQSEIVTYCCDLSKFEAPTGIVFNGEDYTVSWDMVEGATHYDVWYYIVDSENGDAWYANTPVYWFDGEGWMYGLNNESAAVTDGVMTINASYDLNYFAVANNRIGEELELYCVVKVVSDDTSTYADSDWSTPSNVVSYKYQLTTAVESITVSPLSPFVPVGSSYSLGKTITPVDAYYDSISWNSDNEAVVTVDSLGKLYGIASGTAGITAMIGDISSNPVTVTVYQLETNIDQVSQEEAINTANKIINNIVEGDATGTDISDADTAAELIAEGMANEYEFHVDMNQEESAQDYSTSGWNEIEALYSDDDFEPTYADALDVSIELYYEDSVGETTTIGNITEFDSDIQFEIEIPENLPEIEDGYTRDYSVVRVHEGEYEVLECTVNADDTITVESDKFSDFVLLYSDSPDGAETGVEINETNFPDDVFRQYVLDNCDADGNGYLSANEIDNTTTISVPNSGISSLNGIEYFSALTSLSCYSNQLTSLDMSNNLALSYLECGDNQLTNLNVSGCTTLRDLRCNDNQLASLDVSKNTILEYLYCNTNQLLSLDVSNNTKLYSFDCNGNQLTSLDVSNNTVLDYLNCENNQLTSLNVSNNTNLDTLRCQENQLTSLNVSNNTKISSLLCCSNQLTCLDVSGCTSLTDLYCNDNQISEIDFTGCTKLWYLDCSNNELLNLDVSECTLLEGLLCYSNQLTSLDVRNNTNLSTLLCYGNNLTILDISNNNYLVELYNCGMDDGSERSWNNIPDSADFYIDNQYNKISFDSYVSIITSVNYTIIVSETTDGIVKASANTAKVGDVVVVTATPEIGYTLDKIMVNDEEITGNTFEMPAEDVTIEVTFKKIDYTITVNAGTGGAACADKDCANYEDLICVSANADTGYALDKITINGEEITGTTFEMPATDVTVEVTFKKADYTITINNSIGGIVTTSQQSANYQDQITVEVTPNAGYELDTIAVDGVAIEGNSFNMPAKNVTVEAAFRKTDYTITVSETTNGTATVSADTATVGDVVTVTATPETGYLLDKITINGEGITGTTFEMPSEDVIVEVAFKKIQLTVSFNGNGHGTVPAAQTVAYGDKATKPIDPTAAGYTFGGWYTDSACTKEYDFESAVTSNITLYAKWTINTYTVTFNANGHGTAPSAQTVNYGGKASKPADPTATGYTFGGWYTDSACTKAYNFNTAVTANVSLYAKWTVASTPTPTPTATPTPVPTAAPISTPTPTPEPVSSSELLVGGGAHVQDIGDTGVTVDPDTGILTIGTTGMGKRLEEILIDFENNTGYEGTMMYRVHVQDIGWMDWVEAGQKAGTEGMSKRIEAIEIVLTGELADYYSVEYCVHIQDYGDMQGWVHDGALAGTTGESKRIEEIKVRIVPKDSNETMSVMYRVHVQDYGWEKSYSSNGQMAGTSGESKRLEGIEIYLSGCQYSGGIKYKTHVQNIGWESSWAKDGEMSGTQGMSYRLEGICIELYGEVAEYYDIYYRVHAQDIGWMGWAKNGECAGTAARSARLEGIQIVLVPKGAPAPGATYEGITSVTGAAFVEGF